MRKVNTVEQTLELEQVTFRLFKGILHKGELPQLPFRMIPVTATPMEHSNLPIWYQLIQMRHLGLPSRFLDWSMQYDTALYFACASKKEEDGHLWILPIPASWTNGSNKEAEAYLKDFRNNVISISAGDEAQKAINELSPFGLAKYVFGHFPGFIEDLKDNLAERRRVLQGGKFICFPDHSLDLPLEASIFGRLMRKVTIPASAKEGILDELDELGVNKNRLLSQVDESVEVFIKEMVDQAKSSLVKN